MRLLEKIRLRIRYGITIVRVVPILRRLKADGMELAADEATANLVLEELIVANPAAFQVAGLNWAMIIMLILEFLAKILPLLFL